MAFNSENSDLSGNTEDFLRLLTPFQGKIYAYILSRCLNRADADDIMQETVSTIWKKYGSYKSGTDFQAWAITIAKFTVMSFRNKKRPNPIQFNEEAMRILDNKSDHYLKQLDSRLDALANCVKKLESEGKTLLEMKYTKELSVKHIALRLHVSQRSVYKKLSRIHNILIRCVRRHLAEEVVYE